MLSTSDVGHTVLLNHCSLFKKWYIDRDTDRATGERPQVSMPTPAVDTNSQQPAVGRTTPGGAGEFDQTTHPAPALARAPPPPWPSWNWNRELEWEQQLLKVNLLMLAYGTQQPAAQLVLGLSKPMT